MAAEPGYINGELRWSRHNYQLSNSALRHWVFEVKGTVRVCDIASLLYNDRRHLYDMSGGGSGCRWWVYVIPMRFLLPVAELVRYTVLSDWCTRKWLEDNAARTLWPDLLYRYHTTNSRKPLQMVQGTFQVSHSGKK